MAKRLLERKDPHDNRPEESKDLAANSFGGPNDSDEKSSGDGDSDWFDRAIEDVQEATGLSAVFVHGTIRRAVARVGGNTSHITAEDFVRALPSIREALKAFPPSDDAKRRMDLLFEALRKRGPGGGRGEGGTPAVAEVFVQMPRR